MRAFPLTPLNAAHLGMSAPCWCRCVVLCNVASALPRGRGGRSAARVFIYLFNSSWGLYSKCSVSRYVEPGGCRVPVQAYTKTQLNTRAAEIPPAEKLLLLRSIQLPCSSHYSQQGLSDFRFFFLMLALCEASQNM